MDNTRDSDFRDVVEFSAHLRALRLQRLASKSTSSTSRRRYTQAERIAILERLHGHCHICGGEINGTWVVDHVRPRIHGGTAELWNRLPAHATCDALKWFYDAEELQWILKMGIFFRTRLEEQEDPDAHVLAAAFLEHESRRRARRKPVSRGELAGCTEASVSDLPAPTP